MDFLGFKDKFFVLMGLSSRRSIAWVVGQTLEMLGAQVLYVAHSQERKNKLKKLLGHRFCWVCDVEDKDQVVHLAQELSVLNKPIHGFLHSIAFANYSQGFKPFHETLREDFLQAVQVSCFSLIEVANALKGLLDRQASVVTLGISSQVTAENYGYMSPIKAALESSVRFLAKSFSACSEIRFNVVKSGPLKTNASAGIPGYLKAYLYAEAMTLRKKSITTQEVANTVVFLLSSISSGINAQGIVVNGGMDCNYFDNSIIDKVV